MNLLLKRLFFILGRGRSGTTLLREILNAHPQLAVAPESMFVLYTLRKYRRALWTPTCISAFVEDVFLESRMQNWDVTQHELREKLLRVPAPQRHFARMAAEIYGSQGRHIRRDNSLFYGDKNPTYSLFAPQLMSVFPQSTAIVLVRDPLDNVASFRRVPFDANDVATLAWRWRIYNDALLRFVEQSSAKVLLIRYEDLAREPARILSQITAHLGVSFDPEMLHFYEHSRRPLQPWHQNLRRPLSTNRIGSGLVELSAEEQQLITYITAPVALRFNYAHPTPLTNSSMVSQSMAGWLRATAWTFAERGIFHLPARHRAMLIDAYRRSTGSLAGSAGTESMYRDRNCPTSAELVNRDQC